MNFGLIVAYYITKNGIKENPYECFSLVAKQDGSVEFETWNISDKLPQPSMEELEALEPEAMLYYARKEKTSELEQKFNYALENGHTTSSFGVEIDANITSVRNVGGLLVVMGPDDTEMFCDYNNQLHELTRQQVEILQVEIIKYIQGLYDKKWMYREQINTLTTAEEVDSIVIEF